MANTVYSSNDGIALLMAARHGKLIKDKLEFYFVNHQNKDVRAVGRILINQHISKTASRKHALMARKLVSQVARTPIPLRDDTARVPVKHRKRVPAR